MPKFAKRHYEAVARLLAAHDSTVADAIVEDFAAMFADDNPRFDYSKFFKACNPTVYSKEGK